MTSIEIAGSKLKSDDGYGQNGDASASSNLPGQKTHASPKVSPPQATVPNDDWQTRPVSSAQAVPTHPGVKQAPTHQAQIRNALAKQNKQ
jgi:hypothetical protein